MRFYYRTAGDGWIETTLELYAFLRRGMTLAPHEYEGWAVATVKT